MKAAYFKTEALTTVSILIPGTVPRTVRFEFPVGCTVSVAYEGEAENIGFKEWAPEQPSEKN